MIIQQFCFIQADKIFQLVQSLEIENGEILPALRVHFPEHFPEHFTPIIENLLGEQGLVSFLGHVFRVEWPITLDETTYPRDLIETDGVGGTCLWHRQHEWTTAHYAPLMPKCLICGGKCDPRIVAHWLCVGLQKRSLPTPLIDGTPKCGCMACNR